MIFVTVGTQLPFDRLVRAVDEWTGHSGREDVFGQIGPSAYSPVRFRTVAFLSADECRRRMEQASVIVAHAGMGSVLTALQLGKPIVVMPRRAALGEHRNDHQLATAKWLAAHGMVRVAFDTAELVDRLNECAGLEISGPIEKQASPRLLGAVRSFIENTYEARSSVPPARAVGVLRRLMPWATRRPLASPFADADYVDGQELAVSRG